ncbi:MAG TPA: BrnT family toxin [Bryobacteraceae bacterium]|nr:BrnT family toxin [Bryobacteraceae bacterium]
MRRAKRPGADVLYVMYNNMRFEWDAGKSRSNQKKHAGINFETASRIFADPNLMLRKDRVIDGEQRWHGIGAVRKAVLLLVHVYLEENPNGEEVVRIISAREADPRERRIYLEQAP